MAERTGCLWFPDWPVVAARRHNDALLAVPVAVLERGLVAEASAEARAGGVVPGLRRREAESRCPGLAVVEVDEPGEARAFEAVTRAVEAIVPRFELERPGLLSFPTRGPSRYFGGDAALVERVLAAVGETGAADARMGVADGRFAARLAARRSAVVPPGESVAFLAPWPVVVLDDPELANLLTRLGLRTLGAFAALPAPAVLARFGTVGWRAHRRARGLDEHAPAPGAAPPELVEQRELDPPVDRVDVAVFAGKALADRLLERLAALGLACTRVIVEAETEHGERWSRCWRHEGALTPVALAERVRWQLEGWLAHEGALTGGLTLLRLVPDDVVAASGRQLGFWGGDQAAADRADRALARVQGLLEPDAVVTPVPQGGRTPAERVRWVPWGEPRVPLHPTAHPATGARPATPAEQPAWPGAVPGPSPARVFEPSLPAELVDARGRAVSVSGRGDPSAAPAVLRCAALPGGGGEVEAWAGPWAHDLRWWDRRSRCRGALWQVIVGGTDGAVACLVAVEAGRAAVEAIYD
jgi:protein ImuB